VPSFWLDPTGPVAPGSYKRIVKMRKLSSEVYAGSYEVTLLPLDGVTIYAETKKDYILGRLFKVVSSTYGALPPHTTVVEQDIHDLQQQYNIKINVDLECITAEQYLAALTDCTQHGTYSPQAERNKAMGFLNTHDYNDMTDVNQLKILQNKFNSGRK
jgi:hypothetical protein